MTVNSLAAAFVTTDVGATIEGELALEINAFAEFSGDVTFAADLSSFTEYVISTTAPIAQGVYATDVDGDGDTDVLSASFNDNKIAWYESDGGSPPVFTERVISTNAAGARSVYATDVDGDGDTDVLSASRLDDKIAWYESDGGSDPTFTERVISTNAAGARSVYATDVNGDGDTDVLSASWSDNKIAWYESDGGSPPGFTEHVISAFAAGARSVYATDVDGDGDTDVLSASQDDDTIAWYENPMGSTSLSAGAALVADGALINGGPLTVLAATVSSGGPLTNERRAADQRRADPAPGRPDRGGIGAGQYQRNDRGLWRHRGQRGQQRRGDDPRRHPGHR
jgi:hypothetical protein